MSSDSECEGAIEIWECLFVLELELFVMEPAEEGRENVTSRCEHVGWLVG